MKWKYSIKKRLKLAVQVSIITLVLLSVTLLAQAQIPPHPVAHYPLRYDKFKIKPSTANKVIQSWDVSGNARHGSTYNNAEDTLYDKGFTYTWFPDASTTTNAGRRYASKDYNVDVHINIPPPGISGDFNISFWVYYEPTTTSYTVMKLIDYLVLIENGYIALGHNASGYTKYTTNQQLLTSAGWYMVSINVSSGVPTMYVSGVGVGSFSTTSYSCSANGTISSYTLNHGQLMDKYFQGALNNVRFYNANLTTTEMGYIFEEDKNVGSGTYSANSYIVQDVFGYFKFEQNNNTVNSSPHYATNNNATLASGITNTTDRVGNSNKAATFNSGAYLAMKPFWKDNATSSTCYQADYMHDYIAYSNEYDYVSTAKKYPRGFTVSFWYYIPSVLSPPAQTATSGIEDPFTGSDARAKIFYGKKSTDDNVLFGMQQIKDRLGIYRFNNIATSAQSTPTTYPWYLYFYDPMNFSSAGWYHIVWVQYQDWMRLYIYDPSNNEPGYPFYIEIPQEIKDLDEWGIGNKALSANNPTYQSFTIDDFRIYNWPLNSDDVLGLHDLEKSSSLKPGRQDSLSEAGVGSSLSEIVAYDDNFKMYPNPASDKVTLRMNVNEEEHIYLNVSGIDGRVYMRKEYDLEKGSNTFVLSDLNMPPGSYFVTITNSKSLNGSYKFMLLPH